MKKIKLGLPIGIFTLLLFAACSKEGPAGPQGEQGIQGSQ
jgi:hypothetical protein